MRTYLLIFVAILSCSTCFSQNYDYLVDTGKDAYMYYFRGLASHVYPAPKDNQLSDWQVLPFEWKFYGENVTGYYISDNGYITFDNNATNSVPDNVEVPDSNTPRNSIFAFWTDLHLEETGLSWQNEVCSATIGEAPDLIHVIYWIGVVPAATSYSQDHISFAIALYESGGFDIVYSAGSHRKVLNATAGCINADGSLFTFVDESPNIDFPNVGLGDADDVCYQFSYDGNTYIMNEMKDYKISVFPNPTSDFLIISGFEGKAEIINTLGISSWHGAINSGQRINISYLENGIYFLKTNNTILKFIVMK